jgi:hypothetical protein
MSVGASQLATVDIAYLRGPTAPVTRTLARALSVHHARKACPNTRIILESLPHWTSSTPEDCIRVYLLPYCGGTRFRPAH